MDLPPPPMFHLPTTEIVEQITDENELYWFFVDENTYGNDVPSEIYYFAKKHNCIGVFRSGYYTIFFDLKNRYPCGYKHKMRFILKDGNRVHFANPVKTYIYRKHYKGEQWIKDYTLNW